MINKETKIYCSFSSNPGNNGCIFFNSEFKELNMNAIYKSFYSDDIKKSIEAVKSLGIKGFALSMPFKIEALDYVDEVEDSARKIGSINTVVNEDGYLKGYNTDWVGVKKYFETRRFNSIYIIGIGVFSKAVQYTCDVMNIKFSIITRKNWRLIEELDDKILKKLDIETLNFTKLFQFYPRWEITTDIYLKNGGQSGIIGGEIFL